MKKRVDCFFGLHSDFHAKPKEGLVIGATFCEEDVREICENLHPDFIQIDCKGHPGYASYPTKMGNAMPTFQKDPLKIWRSVTREYGVSLYMHYSGVYDIKYCREHPDARVMKADGTCLDYVRFDSNYVDELLIPQISELVEEYEIDGIWIDGDCWSTWPDYHPETLALFQKQTGISLNGNLPKEVGDPYFREYLDFTRERFREYLRYYVDTLHSKYPDLQICSNWAFSDHMPEPVSANVDFISGDLNPDNCVNSARYAGRMMAQQNMPWDLMSWHFRYGAYGDLLIPPKHVTQILQEAASVIAIGGAYQDNIGQFPDGTPNVEQMRSIRPLAEFMRAREAYCFRGKIIPQVALLVPTYDFQTIMKEPFDRCRNQEFISLTALLCESGLSLETLCEFSLSGRMADYPVIIVPELVNGLHPDFMEQLRAYVTGGGNLVLMGIHTPKLFAEAGFPFAVEDFKDVPDALGFADCNNGHDAIDSVQNPACYFRVMGGQCGQSTGVVTVRAENAKTIATACQALRGEGKPFVAVSRYGKGKLAIIGTNLATQYMDRVQYQHKEIIRYVADELFAPLAKIESSLGVLEIVCLEKSGRLMLQLVNGNGHHADRGYMSEEFIPPVLDIQLSIKMDAPPKELLFQPEGKAIPFCYQNGRVYFDLPRVDIHNIVEVIV